MRNSSIKNSITNWFYGSFIILFCLVFTRCSNTPTTQDQPTADARLLPFSLEESLVKGKQFKVKISCLEMDKMEYFVITVVGKSGATQAALKKTETEIYTDENGKTKSRLVAEYQAETDLESIGDVLVFLEGIVHPNQFAATTFKENADVNKDWIPMDAQQPLAKTLRGDQKQLDQCYRYQWKTVGKSTTLHRKAKQAEKCKTVPTSITLQKMKAKQFKDFKLLENSEAEVLYWKDQLVFVSQGEYSKAAATPVYAFQTNDQMNYIVKIGVKRSNTYGLLIVKDGKITLQVFPYC